MANIFIDCGGNFGQSIERFKRSNYYFNDFIIHSFEPNPVVKSKSFNLQNVIYHNEAIWVRDGEVDFYLDMLKVSDSNKSQIRERVKLAINEKSQT